MAQAETEYITRVVQLGQPTTIKEITELLDAGFRKESEADGFQFYRKAK